METLRQVIDKHFKEDRTKFFHPSDRQGECYLRYHFDGGVEITMGTNDGEIVVLFTSDPERLDKFITLILYR